MIKNIINFNYINCIINFLILLKSIYNFSSFVSLDISKILKVYFYIFQ